MSEELEANEGRLSPKDLIPGLKFAQKYRLAQKEMEALSLFIEKPSTNLEISEKLGKNKITLHGIIQRLKLKNVLVLKSKDEKGTYLYEFNPEILKE